MIGWQAEAAPQPFARIQAAVERHAGPVQLEALIVGAGSAIGTSSRAGKRFRVNSIPRRAIDLVGQLRAVLFTADDLEIISGGPGLRRQYLDVAISQLDRRYYGALSRYGRILQQRNATLRRIREGVANTDELALWDDGFAREGAVLIAARRTAVTRLTPLVQQAHLELSGAQESLAVRYEPRLGEEWQSLLPDQPEPEAVVALFSAAVAGQRRREVAAGVSLVGPHRDDLTLELNGVAAAAFASRAQMRTAALSLRLAEARLLTEDTGDPPVLLLDDIVSELDERRRASVLQSIGESDQVWLTATDAAGLPAAFLETCAVYRVQAGTIAREP
jgi:DNA replication and repair protein RecF